MSILTELKAFPTDSGDLEDMVFYSGQAEVLVASYKQFDLEPPEWLVEKQAALGREIAIRQRDYLQRELKKTELSLDSLRTAEEKREDLRAKAEKLRSKLGAA